MATYLQGMTDLVPQIAPFQPDFGLIQKTLSTLQSRYDQGFASVKNVYNQVLNAPLTDLSNQDMRKTFLQEAQTRLKDLSSVDLSIPENQTVAENVFSPFWEDNMILQDTGYTRWYQNEMSKAEQTRDSKDEKIRSQYSDIAYRYLQNGLDKLQDAGRNPDNYKQLERRRFVPFQDIKSYLDERASKADLKIVWDEQNGPALVHRENGLPALQSFKVFAHNMLGDQFQEQFRVTGVVDKEERMRQIKQTNPNLTDQQALEMMSSSVVDELKEGTISRQKSLDAALNKINQKMNDYAKQKVLTKEQDRAYLQLSLQKLQLESQQSQTKDELSELDSQSEATRQSIIANPDSYFARLHKQQAIDGWAIARAENQKTKIEVNPVWQEKVKEDKEKHELELDERRVRVLEQNLELEKWKALHPVTKTGKPASGSGNGTSGNGTDISNPETTGNFEGYDTTPASKIPITYDLFNQQQQEKWERAHTELFSPEVGGQVLTGLGVNIEDSINYMELMQKLSKDPDVKKLQLGEQIQLYNLNQILNGHADQVIKEDDPESKVTGVKNEINQTDFYKVRTSLFQAMKNHLEENAQVGSPSFDGDLSMLLGYSSATQSIQEHDALEKAKNEAIDRTILSGDEYKKFTVDKNGVKSVVAPEDLGKRFKPIILKGDDGKKLNLTGTELARLYMNGSVDIPALTAYGRFTHTIEIDGKKYEVEDYDYGGKKYWWGHPAPLDSFEQDLETVNRDFGSSKDFKKKMDEAKEKAISNLPDYQNETGKIGFVIGYDLNKKTTGETAIKLLREASLPANHEGVYVDGKLEKGDVEKAILKVMSMGEADLQNFISYVRIKTNGINNRPSLQVLFKPTNKASKNTSIAGASLSALSDANDIQIDLNPNASGETLERIRYNPGNYVYGSLLKGETLKSDAILNAANYSFTIVPTNSPKGAVVEVRANDFVNGKYVPKPVARQSYTWKEVTPDELVQRVLYGMVQHQQANKLAKELYVKQQQLLLEQNGERQRTPQEVRDEAERVWQGQN
jgi:hypothetical protein